MTHLANVTESFVFSEHHRRASHSSTHPPSRQPEVRARCTWTQTSPRTPSGWPR